MIEVEDDGAPVAVTWRYYASCKGMTGLFYPTYAETGARRDIREARCIDICRECPVRVECSEEAYAHPSDYHDLVMGGETEAQRRRWRVSNRRSARQARLAGEVRS